MPDCPRKLSTAIRNDLEIFKDYQPAESKQPPNFGLFGTQLDVNAKS
jgi:hypothetical protein